ncbi:MAG: NPCBM/NEW2 domain-containing protein [Clostridia bacterium]|nr:NPCBM/NEW2 domain-containing protein [Clostridia bacterium]
MKKHLQHLLRLISLALVLLTVLPLVPLSLPASAEEVESRKTPIMGWASWNAYRTDISEEIILSQAEKLVELGLKDLGYVFVNVDDGWQNGRGEDGYVATNEKRFPSGMKSLAEKIHAMGLKAGIYTDAGDSTCGWESDNEKNNDDVGLYGHDEQDLRRYFIDWEYDFIKVDWCGGRRLGLDKKDRYTTIGKVVADIEKEIGKDKIYNVCCWSFPGEWVTEVADSWRTGGDIFNNFGAVMEQLDNIKSLAKYNTPGHVNDLDMMQVGNGMTYEEDKSHFAMWCMMSTPLMLGMDLNSISEETLSIISNAELIALNQDPACIQATVAKKYGSVEAWTKDLGSKNSGKKAIALLNRDTKEQTVTISFKELGLDGVSVVRDLWAHSDLATDDHFTVTIPAHGTVVLTAEGTPIATEADKDILVDDGSVVSAEMSVKAKPSAINLSTLGTYDWVHYGNETTRMADGAQEISVDYDGSYLTYGNAAAKYTWSNAEGAKRSGTSTYGAGVKGSGTSITLSTPCDQNERTLIATVGSFSAEMTVELIVGGKVIESKVIPGGSDKKVDKLVTVTYKSDIPTTAYLRWTVSKSLGYSDSVNVEGVALNINITQSTLGAPIVTKTEKGYNASVNLTVTEENAKLYLVTKNEKGEPTAVTSKAVSAGEKLIKTEVPLTLPNDFKGTLYAYLWDTQNRPLTASQKTALDTTSISGYNVGPMTAKKLIADGAVLLDVRSPEEFAKGHLDGAVNLDYSKVALEAEKTFTDKNKPIVVYCSAAKRSAQAVDALVKLGYTKVYNLGSMDNYDTEALITFSTDTCKVITTGEKVGVNFTASPYDNPTVYVSAGKNSTLKDAVPLSEFKVPEVKDYYLTLKAYLVQDGVCHATVEKQFIYWSEETVDAFATDLAWTEATIGWGSIRKNKSVGGNTLKLAGKNFSHGIGTHANSTITMNVPEGAKKFLAVAGCDLEMSGSNTMMFFVYIDGVEADHSSLIKIGQHYVFDVDIPEGAEEITLYAYEGTYGGNTNDHADWTVAGFINDPTAN